jgi:transposase
MYWLLGLITVAIRESPKNLLEEMNKTSMFNFDNAEREPS